MLLDTASLYFRAFFGVPDVHGPRRDAGQRRARAAGVHQPAGQRLPADAPGLLLGQRLAAAVAGRPAPVVQGAPGRALLGRARPDVEEVPDPLEQQIPIIRDVLEAFGITRRRRRRLRGRRRDRHARDRTPACRSTSSPATATCSSSSTTRPRCGCSTPPAGSASTSGSPTTCPGEVRRRRAASTPPSRPCAATPPTGCPGVAGVGEKTAAMLLNRFGDIDGIIAAAQDPDADMAPGPRGKIKAADYLEVAPTVVAVARDIDLGSPDLTLRAPRPNPSRGRAGGAVGPGQPGRAAGGGADRPPLTSSRRERTERPRPFPPPPPPFFF